MGGYGSGRRTHKRGLVDGYPYSDYLCLDISTFRRKGQWRYLSATFTWSRGEVKRASLSYVVRCDGITLYWQTRSGESVQQHIAVTTVSVNYGRRYFFLCPNCQRRVAKLYAGSYFHCRHCYNLTYESCQESHKRFFARLGLSDKQHRNFFKAIEYARELEGRKWVGARMLRRLNRYVEKSNVQFGVREG